MSLSTSFSSLLQALNRPPVVLTAGTLIAAGIPSIVPAIVVASSSVLSSSLVALQTANVLSFAVNVASVSVPGRWDSTQQDDQIKMLGPNETEKKTSTDGDKSDDKVKALEKLRSRSLVQPSGWAFSIWSVIYIGELTFCATQFVDPATQALLPSVTGPFVAANLIQSLWCASFRPSYNDEWWHKYVSVAMLGGTAYSLSWISNVIGTTTDPDAALLSWVFVPMVIHFGWTTAATLVNLNTSVATNETVSESTLIALGHASALVATALGVALPLLGVSTPAYGMTVAWALLAVGSNPILEPKPQTKEWTDAWYTGAKFQRMLCYAGSTICLGASVYGITMGT